MRAEFTQYVRACPGARARAAKAAEESAGDPASGARVSPENDVVSDDDEAPADEGMSAEELVARQLGGIKIEE